MLLLRIYWIHTHLAFATLRATMLCLSVGFTHLTWSLEMRPVSTTPDINLYCSFV